VRHARAIFENYQPQYYQPRQITMSQHARLLEDQACLARIHALEAKIAAARTPQEILIDNSIDAEMRALASPKPEREVAKSEVAESEVAESEVAERKRRCELPIAGIAAVNGGHRTEGELYTDQNGKLRFTPERIPWDRHIVFAPRQQVSQPLQVPLQVPLPLGVTHHSIMYDVTYGTCRHGSVWHSQYWHQGSVVSRQRAPCEVSEEAFCKPHALSKDQYNILLQRFPLSQ
jgi:hypothetical protein